MGNGIQPPMPLMGPGAVRAGGVPVAQPSPNLQQYPPSTAANVATGIASFLQQYQQGKDAERQRAYETALHDIDLIGRGVPMDHEAVAKNLKKSGVHFDFEGNNPLTAPEQAPPPQATPQQSIPPPTGSAGTPVGSPAVNPATPGPPGGGDPALTSLLAGQAAAAPTVASMQPYQKGTHLRQLLERMGLAQPNINAASPGMAWLDQLAGRGREQAELSGQELENAKRTAGVRHDMLTLLTDAMHGDPHAMELAQRLPGDMGLKQLPFDGLMGLASQSGMPATKAAGLILNHALGGPQQMQHIQDMAEKFAPHFGGDLGKALQYTIESLSTGRSSLKPQLSLEEETKVQDTIDKMANQYPTAPLNLLRSYANMEFTGQKGPARSILDYMSNNFPRKETILQGQFNQTLQQHKDQMAQEYQIQSEHLDLAKKQAMAEAADKEFAHWESVRTNKDATFEQQQEAVKGLVDALNAKGEIPLTFKDANGKMKTMTMGTKGLTTENIWKIGSPIRGENIVLHPPMKRMNDYTGKAPTVGDALKSSRQQAIDQFMKWNQEMSGKEMELFGINPTDLTGGQPPEN